MNKPLSQPRREAATAAARYPAAAVLLLTALAYALVGALSLVLAGPPGYASPLFPAAGIALAAALVCGRAALPGVWLGSFAINCGLGLQRGDANVLGLLVLPLLIAAGATLQAALGASLVRRFVSRPLVLNAPRDILRFGLLGALLACTVSATVAVAALVAGGALAPAAALPNWLTWWAGDTLGVLIAAPLVLTLIGRPSADWRTRRRTVGLPLLLALALLGTGMAVLSRIEQQRVEAGFERDADRLASAAENRLQMTLHALQALRGAVPAQAAPDAELLAQATRWWLAQPLELQAMGYSERVAEAGLPAFEAAARGQGLAGYRVFERDEGAARRADREVVALRLIEPLDRNRRALGVNALSIPAARDAILATRDSGEPAASAGFRLTQADGDETGVVIYQALYRGPAADLRSRQANFRGVVFATVSTERALDGLAVTPQAYLRWCLVDTEAGVPRPRLAGPPGCEQAAAVAGGGFEARRSLRLAGRSLELRISAPANAVPGRQREAAWLLSMVGLAAAAMLGALLLTVTGHSRRTELAVLSGTAELRREIAEHAQAEAALRESEERLRSILDHVPLGVMFLDPRGHLIDCNPRLCEMLGRSADELRGRSVAQLMPVAEFTRLRTLRRELLSGAGTAVVEPLHLQTADGRELVVRVRTSAIRVGGHADGAVLRLVGVLEDITEHLRLQTSERALQRAEAANRAKSEFVSRMSHELRTPLNAMIGFAQLLGLDREPALPAHQREWTQQIQRAGWHLLEMINETLDLARIESGAVQLSLAPVALPTLVAACRAMVAAPATQRGLRIVEAIDGDAAAVMGDATRLKQVLTNLLSNAVKYNREGGGVTLTSRRLVLDSQDWVEIAVADTGLGMTAEQQQALFQPYNRLGREGTDIEGTGIGLVISRRLTELMGGTLEASSEAGTGSIFTLRLPAADAAESPLPVYTDTSPAPYPQRLVHYVEDNETNIEVMRGIFAQRAQIRLETSMLGLDGLAAIRHSRPDLVLLDMQLPDISGLELLRHLKQDDTVAAIPVVVVSADATSLQTQRALTSGAAHYVTKPLDVTSFLQLVDSILEAAESRWG